MDLLGEVLLSLKVESNSGGIYTLGNPWGLSVPAFPVASAYALFCLDVPMWLMASNQAPVRLEPGDSVLLLHGIAYRVASSPDSDCVDLMEYWHANELPKLVAGKSQAAPISGLELGEGEKVGCMMILAFLLQAAQSNPLLHALPSVIHLKASTSGIFPSIGSLVEFLVEEETASRPGYVATAAHISNLIISSFIRAYALSAPQDRSGWLKGIADRRIRQALAAMHARPGDPWTTDSLAVESSMSRHTFGRRFTRLVGQSPIDYLIDLRMQIAAEHLRAGRPVARVAEAVGYNSERAFREVFRKRFGVSPLRYSKVED
ncbi:AraC family transcriptional regulator [Pseudomonas putida]|uniref:AraC family transcriptional regulator n=1 Tax=Pseudomonas putida TaxID=303 RepID=UPI00226EE93B|nr:AraC family transcriptional regulator [Pseudomonas putida]WAB99240.1 AraC family transcriptional regulator [Pseudomonas putida]